MSYPYTECRALGHRWDPVIRQQTRRTFGTPVVVQCSRCAMIRQDGVSVLGQVITRRYDLPEGYRLSPEERLTKEQWRLQAIGRWAEFAKRTEFTSH